MNDSDSSTGDNRMMMGWQQPGGLTLSDFLEKIDLASLDQFNSSAAAAAAAGSNKNMKHGYMSDVASLDNTSQAAATTMGTTAAQGKQCSDDDKVR